MADLTDFLHRKAKDSVTPTKWRYLDELNRATVYERTGENRAPEIGELIWADSSEPAPYPFQPSCWKGRQDRPCENCGQPDRYHVLTGLTLYCPKRITPIWRLAEDQTWKPPEPAGGPRPGLDELIRQ